VISEQLFAEICSLRARKFVRVQRATRATRVQRCTVL